MNHNEMIEDLTVKAEKGENVSEALNTMGFQERLQILKEMDKKNEEHRQSGSTVTDLVLVTDKDDKGQTHAVDMYAQGRGGYLFASNSYDLPESAENMLCGPNGEKAFGLFGKTLREYDLPEKK